MGLLKECASGVLPPWKALTEKQRAALRHWKYLVENNTILDPFMQPFWWALSRKVPSYILPNTITTLGVFFNMLPCLALLFFSPRAQEEAPGWLMVVSAVGLFLYQLADALDGKQCLKLDRDTPLEELFDHGLDAVTNCFITISVCIALGLGDYPFWMLITAATSCLLFFSYHWQTFNSGVVIFGRFDVTEAQFCTMFIFLLTAAFGRGLWTTVITIMGYSVQVRQILIVWILTMGCFCIRNNVWIVFRHAAGLRKGCVTGWESMKPLMPLLQQAFVIYMVRKFYPPFFFEEPCLFVMSFSFVSALLVLKLVIAHLLDSSYPLFHLGPHLLAIFIAVSVCVPTVKSTTLNYIIIAASVLEYLYVFVWMTREVCKTFNINCYIPGRFEDPIPKDESLKE